MTSRWKPGGPPCDVCWKPKERNRETGEAACRHPGCPEGAQRWRGGRPFR